MTESEYIRAFEARLPVYAKISTVAAEPIVIAFSCINAIVKRWHPIQLRPFTVLELLDKNSNSTVTASPEECFLNLEEAECKQHYTLSTASGPPSPQGEGFGKELDGLIEHYQRYTGALATPSIRESLENYLMRGMSVQVRKRVIEYAAENNSRNWRYINAILLGKLTKGVKTLEEYDRDEGLWEERKKRMNNNSSGSSRSKFNNYTDTNKPDYSDFGQQIIADMLSSAETLDS